MKTDAFWNRLVFKVSDTDLVLNVMNLELRTRLAQIETCDACFPS